MSRGVVTRAALAILLGGLILGLPACATRAEFVLPPAELLADCKKTPMVGSTNLDLARAFNARGRDIDECNADKAGLRAWASELDKK